MLTRMPSGVISRGKVVIKTNLSGSEVEIDWSSAVIMSISAGNVLGKW